MLSGGLADGQTNGGALPAASLSYDDYKALVVVYLEPEHAELYSSRETWDAMQLEVIGRIEALR